MPAPTIARKPIPKFSKSDLNIANQCATALWHGINFKTGDFRQISEAYLLARFATNFYNYQSTGNQFTPGVFEQNIRELIIACGIKMLFRGIADMNIKKGITSLYKDVYPKFLSFQKNPNQKSSFQTSVACLEKLNKGLVRNSKSNRLNLASRILFFVTPNLHTFNMNNNIAIFFGLQWRPHHHYAEYFELFSKGMITNQTNLSKYKIPKARDGLDDLTWNKIKGTDWWKRRVLDMAVLLLVDKKMTVNPNLNSYIRQRQKLDTI